MDPSKDYSKYIKNNLSNVRQAIREGKWPPEGKSIAAAAQ